MVINTVLGYTDGYTSPEQYIIALDAQSAKSIPMHDQIDEKVISIVWEQHFTT